MFMKWSQQRARAELDKYNQVLYEARASLEPLLADHTIGSEQLNKARKKVRDLEEDLEELLEDWRSHTSRKYRPKYAPDWSTVAKRVKEAADWTCVSCGAVLWFGWYRKLLHVHHVNRLTKDNRPQNLMALCVLCHAAQEDHHGIVFSEEDARIIEKCRPKQG